MWMMGCGGSIPRGNRKGDRFPCRLKIFDFFNSKHHIYSPLRQNFCLYKQVMTDTNCLSNLGKTRFFLQSDLTKLTWKLPCNLLYGIYGYPVIGNLTDFLL